MAPPELPACLAPNYYYFHPLGCKYFSNAVILLQLHFQANHQGAAAGAGQIFTPKVSRDTRETDWQFFL